MASAYGLYTHIQSNRRRSIALLIGLFLLVYVMVYAGALLAEVSRYNAPLDWFLRQAWHDTVIAALAGGGDAGAGFADAGHRSGLPPAPSRGRGGHAQACCR